MAKSEQEKTTDELALAAIDEIHKQYGASSIMKMSDRPQMAVEFIPTTIAEVDQALGGGFARGRVAEIYGVEMSAKSTLALYVVASALRMGLNVAYLDAEHALDPDYMKMIGVDPDELYLSQPDWGEQALDIADKLAASGAFGLIVIDSIAALTPKAEIEGSMGDAHVGLHARMMSQAMRKLTANLKKSNTALICINQLREKIGVMFGSPETTPGGRALKFYSSQRVDMRQVSEKVTEGDDIIGNKVKVNVVKNKVAPPYKKTEIYVMYGMGIDRERSLLNAAESLGVVARKGSWYYGPDGEQFAQGAYNAAEFLRSDAELFQSVYDGVYARLAPAVES